MASVIIGRTKCPECFFEAAHVKKSDKCSYRYCPDCGAQYHAKTARQVTDLLAKTRLIEPPSGSDPTTTPTDEKKPSTAPPIDAAPTPSRDDSYSTNARPPPPPAARRRLF